MLGQLTPGELVGLDFEVVELISRGGFGDVYKVVQRRTHKTRALKVLQLDLCRRPEERARFQNEARISARVESDHVVDVIDAGVLSDDRLWIAMEFLSGVTVEEELRKSPEGLKPARWNLIARQLCHGLSAVHRKQVVHRDLKPANVFLARPRHHGVPFTVKILDFGISAQNDYLIRTAIGSLLWMAPEQMTAGAKITPATDAWSLGLLIFNLIVGRPFWLTTLDQADAQMRYIRECCVDPIVTASTRAAQLGVRFQLPPWFDTWFSRCVAREPEKRFPSATEAGAALDMIGGA
jgi:serine/threonine protein kinase